MSVYTLLATSVSGHGRTLVWGDERHSYLDDYELDLEIVAGRLEREYSAESFAKVIGINAASIRQGVKRGRLPAPEVIVPAHGGTQYMWTAAQVASEVIKRGVRV